ncbi:UvrD-helicase domain-containing protein [Natrarchaeobaculum sulfurireducens]|uniref:DNA 3'-5' helicase n=1 Tax=Natrarchaeobaculum sulfurireducens TaxID=2044521 RepID=A0A346PFZ5_9EURY|nr:UvrD-helicase domain-containing protein [Natrarchaeobaculum sulfurireducens]AXR78440.1 UvrD/Rep family helicase fused to exonuclease family domain [Natrarchaeobaculum sulfurireducens]
MGDRWDGAALEPKGDQQAVIDERASCLSVDAGAGTGKTTTMLLRIERAIDRGEVDPDDVLVLTFANEAAGSIREAVSRRLEPEAAAAIDVYTYHSFCHRLVREYAYHLGYSPDFEIVTDRKRRRIIGRLLAETDYGFAAPFVESEASTADLVDRVDTFVATMSREDVSPADLRAGLPDVRTLELCTEFVLWLERRADDRLSFDEEAFRYFNREEHLETARESLVEYGKLVEYCREKIAESPAPFRDDDVVRDIDRYFRALQTCVTKTIETLSLDDPTTKHLPRALFGNQIHGTATTRIEQTPLGRLKHHVEFLRLARHYADVYADYHAHLEAERALDFDELVRTATALVAGEPDPAGVDRPTAERIADGLTAEWDQVYCDEFQDTDETQFSLITALTDGPDRPELLAIGDKDQAIYGWRGTDREGLDRLADVYDDHEALALELNFRSRQEILDLTNHCYYDGQSTKTLREDGRTPGEYWCVDEPDDPDGPPDRVVVVESDDLESDPADQVAATVSRLLNGEATNVPRRDLADVAVIVRTNRHAQAVAGALRDRQIPYEISGSPRGTVAPGIQTLLSYLRALVDPDADVHLRRVLTYRYRLPAADLRTLQRRDGSLFEAVFDVNPETLERPNRLETARTHLEMLSEQRDVYPLSGFLRRFRELTRLEWFLTGEERAELDRLDRFVDAYGGDDIIRRLTDEFVDALERLFAGSGSDRTRGTRSEDCVDVMTVHQAKGLEFDTVLVPYLSDEEWCVDRDYAERARYRLLAATLAEDVQSPLCADLEAESVAEEWRVLHVALTRAENHLFVFGSAYDYDGEEGDLAASSADACLAPEVEWSVTGRRMDLWETLRSSFERVRETYPRSVADRTDEIGRSAGTSPGTITYYAGYDDRPIEPLETREAIETVHRLGRLLRTETLLPAADAADVRERVADVDGDVPTIRVPNGRSLSALSADTVRFPLTALTSRTDLEAAIYHSYSALETHETCPRKHYLEHVVRAIDDPEPTGAGRRRRADGRSSARVVGTVFHDVAEEAFYREYRTREEWREAAVRQLTARGLLESRDELLACVDRYFEAHAPTVDSPIAEWPQLAAELPFSLADVPGLAGDVVGYVDSVRRLPTSDAAAGEAGDGLVVLDYKTTAERIDPEDAVQLALYVRACNDRFDEPIVAAGYVYVGDVDGPGVELFDPAELPAWDDVRDALEAVDDPSYQETRPGAHCRFCPHRSLGCAPAEYGLSEIDALEGTGDD